MHFISRLVEIVYKYAVQENSKQKGSDRRASLREVGSQDSNNSVKVHQKMRVQPNEWELTTASMFKKPDHERWGSTRNGRDGGRCLNGGETATREKSRGEKMA